MAKKAVNLPDIAPNLNDRWWKITPVDKTWKCIFYLIKVSKAKNISLDDFEEVVASLQLSVGVWEFKNDVSIVLAFQKVHNLQWTYSLYEFYSTFIVVFREIVLITLFLS